MRHLTDHALPGKSADTLIIMLPGAYQQPEDFVQEGFVSAVRERELPVDIIMAELSFVHIVEASALADIHNSLVLPAQAAGYRQIWLAGISIGGYVAIAYADHYPDILTGLLLLAPYPGNRMTTGEINLAGSVQAWQPASPPAADSELRNWYWLKKHSGDIKVNLGYGAQDRFAGSHALMATVLPEEQLDIVQGDHEWPVWLQLWQNFLDRQFVDLQALS
ncbi:MAG: alpha/beta hydrolase [Nitrosomonadales bacterium]|nr:alpha/beta hydrolase [Nitrosomonadales bacterium]